MADSIKSPVETRNRQKVVAITVGGGFLALVILALWLSDPNAGKNRESKSYFSERQSLSKDYQARPSKAVTDEDHWILRSEEELAEMRKDSIAKQTEINALLGRLQKLEEAQKRDRNLIKDQQEKEAAALDSVKNLIKETHQSGKNIPTQDLNSVNSSTIKSEERESLNKRLPPPPSPEILDRNRSANKSIPGGSANVPGMQHVSLRHGNKNNKSKIEKNIQKYLPTGTLSKGVFLTGVDAPTGGSAQSNPHPVLIRIKSLGNLPNFARSHLKDCHILGAASGNISSERVEIRLETLTCILKNGDVVEVKVKGYVTGEDGKMGMRGRVVEKQGQLIAKALVAGAISGVSQVVSQQSRVYTTNPLGSTTSLDPQNIGEAGVAEGISSAMERLADYYFDRLDEMYPIIEMGAGRICDIILTGGTDLKQEIIGNTNEM